jgi:hypothetical protein
MGKISSFNRRIEKMFLLPMLKTVYVKLLATFSLKRAE